MAIAPDRLAAELVLLAQRVALVDQQRVLCHAALRLRAQLVLRHLQRTLECGRRLDHVAALAECLLERGGVDVSPEDVKSVIKACPVCRAWEIPPPNP